MALFDILMCISGRYCVPGVSLSAVLWAVLCAASQHPAGLVPVPQSQGGCGGVLALLAALDSAAAAGLEQVLTCINLLFYLKCKIVLERKSELKISEQLWQSQIYIFF